MPCGVAVLTQHERHDVGHAIHQEERQPRPEMAREEHVMEGEGVESGRLNRALSIIQMPQTGAQIPLNQFMNRENFFTCRSSLRPIVHSSLYSACCAFNPCAFGNLTKGMPSIRWLGLQRERVSAA